MNWKEARETMNLINELKFVNKSVIAATNAIAQMTYFNEIIKLAVPSQSIWEIRQHRWEAKWDSSDDCSRLYRRLADQVIAYGFSDLSNVQPWLLKEKRGLMSLKQIAEALVRHRLPDINPAKCLEFAKETPFSAENWYNGCTEEWL